ncbi:NAD-dependent epimerase/dehydratase family protein [Luteibacter sp.]|jgi:nucleoside-diphosphate-sugar epimerase|uniref:NAD-dependent epimerase/dehydratase family protein n=1 Tax=Luteibacter sp. TaxID=1886636 RepID=UPI0028076612|nr:NAD-dependent epimerase/dehydratase family protein [Luteibacter sp.]MDQ8049431.1 NAD-dependent epimerase/dehydratase family protein [Luteibacter sp.]
MNDLADSGHPVIALTGATGFIGTALRERLVAAGYRVRALYRPRPGRVLENAPGVKWIAGDLNDRDALAALVQGADAVVHCAGNVRGARAADFDVVNEAGVIDIVRAAREESHCHRFLLVSSLAAREPQLSDYSRSKWLGERALAAHAGDLVWAALRPPAVYGPGDREMLPLFQSMARGIAPIPGSGDGRFSLIHVSDLASAIVAWLRSDTQSGQTFELDDGHEGGYDWDTVLSTASRVLRDNAPIRRLLIPAPLLRAIAGANRTAARVFGYAPMLTPGKVRELTHADWVCDGRAFTRATGWTPEIGFERGLAATLGNTVTH